MHIDHLVSALPPAVRAGARQRLEHVPEAMLQVVDEHIGAGIRVEGLVGPNSRALGLYTSAEHLVKIGRASTLAPPSNALCVAAGIAEFGARSALISGVLAAAGATTATALTYGIGGTLIGMALADAAPQTNLATHVLGLTLPKMLNTAQTDILVHECSHALDEALGKNDTRPLAKAEYGTYHDGQAIQAPFRSLRDPHLIEMFEKCQKSEPGHHFVSFYAGSHPVEYFAESMRVYLKDRKALNAEDPEMTAYLDGVVHVDVPKLAGLPTDLPAPLEAGQPMESAPTFYKIRPKPGLYVGERFERYYENSEKLRAAETIPPEGLKCAEVRGAVRTPAQKWTANLAGFAAGLAAHVGVALAIPGGGPAGAVIRAFSLTFPMAGVTLAQAATTQSVTPGRVFPKS